MQEQEIVKYGDKWAKIESLNEDGTAEIRIMEIEDGELNATDETSVVNQDELTSVTGTLEDFEEQMDKVLEDLSEEELKALEEELEEEEELDKEEEEGEDLEKGEREELEEEALKKAKIVVSAKNYIKEKFQKAKLTTGSFAAYLGYSNIQFLYIHEIIGSVAIVSSMYVNDKGEWTSSSWIDLVLSNKLVALSAFPEINDLEAFISDEAKSDGVSVNKEEIEEIEEVEENRAAGGKKKPVKRALPPRASM